MDRSEQREMGRALLASYGNTRFQNESEQSVHYHKKLSSFSLGLKCLDLISLGHGHLREEKKKGSSHGKGLCNPAGPVLTVKCVCEACPPAFSDERRPGDPVQGFLLPGQASQATGARALRADAVPGPCSRPSC